MKIQSVTSRDVANLATCIQFDAHQFEVMESFDMPSVDEKWLRDRMADTGLNQKRLAEMVGLDRSTLNRLIKGTRPWKTEWTLDVARALRVPAGELIAKLGLQMPRDITKEIPLIGVASETGAIAPVKGAGHRGVERPTADIAAGTAAVRVQAPGLAWDGWIVFFAPVSHVAPEAVGKLAIVELRNKGGKWLGVLQRGYSAGKWNIFRLDGTGGISDVEIASAAPVSWVRT